MKLKMDLNRLIEKLGLVPAVSLILGFAGLASGRIFWFGSFIALLCFGIAWHYIATSSFQFSYHPDPLRTYWNKGRLSVATLFFLLAALAVFEQIHVLARG